MVKTSLEKYLIGAVIVLSLAAAGLLAGLLVLALTQSESEQPCLTPGCIETANTLLKNMDMSADP